MGSYCACVFVDLCLDEKMIFFQQKLMKPESEFILRECWASRNSATHLPNITEFKIDFDILGVKLHVLTLFLNKTNRY